DGRQGQSRLLVERLHDLCTPLLGPLQRGQHRPLALGAHVVAPAAASVETLSHPIRPSCLSLASIIAATPPGPPSAASTSIHCTSGSRGDPFLCRRRSAARAPRIRPTRPSAAHSAAAQSAEPPEPIPRITA